MADLPQDRRAQIARELHDVASHQVAVALVQANAARHRVGRDPDGAIESLASVRLLARDALGDARRLRDVMDDGAR